MALEWLAKEIIEIRAERQARIGVAAMEVREPTRRATEFFDARARPSGAGRL
jgi:hypothetical protein